MPKFGAIMENGKIIKWVKNIGEQINKNEILAVIEAEKVTVDYESPEEGIVLKILVNEGENAAVGKPIAIVGEKNENIDDLLSSEISTVEEKPLADNERTASISTGITRSMKVIFQRKPGSAMRSYCPNCKTIPRSASFTV